MVVQRSGAASKLIVKVETGVTANGTATYSQRTFTHINPELGDADVLDLGKALGGLQAHPVVSVNRQDAAKLEEA